MIYPKDIVDFVKTDNELRAEFGWVIEQDSLNVTSTGFREITNRFEFWMVTEGYRRSEAIARYVLYLSTMVTLIQQIWTFFPRTNPSGRKEVGDDMSIASSPEEMFAISRYLYYLHSYGIDGCVLECGCFKGWSSSCLSWACYLVGKKLVVADSFQGLPKEFTEDEAGYYREGDYRGDFEEVVRNVTLFGRASNVEFRKGWFNESLKGFGEQVCLLWMDVDLYKSAMDVMTNIFHAINTGGVIVSHEFDAERWPSEPAVGPVKAVIDYLNHGNVKYVVAPVFSRTGIIVPYAEGLIRYLPTKDSFWWNNMFPWQRKIADHERLVARLGYPIRLISKIPVLGTVSSGLAVWIKERLMKS